MNIGDYVRTDTGYIIKISDFKEHYTKGKRFGFNEDVIENFLLLDDKQCEIIESIDYSIPPCYPSDEELEKIKSHIIKSSPNIIDLIEVGDYVNGFRVEDVYKPEGTYVLWLTLSCNPIDRWKNEDIKSIVTHQQFSQMEYKL